MPTSYTSLLGLALPVTGELSGTWGDTVNDYITQYLDASVAGTQTISGSQTAVTLSKTTATSLSQAGSGATGSSQYMIINCTGNPASMLTITAPAASKPYIVINGTSTSQDVKIVGAGPTTGVTLAASEKAVVAWNGSDFVKVASSVADGVTTIDFGTTGLTPNTATSGAVTVAGTLSVANGGTGQTTYTNGQLLIGNTTGNTLAKSTLTAGSGVTITNGAGTITISATGSGGDAVLSANNAFTGANTFYNVSGQTFGTGTSTQDGIVLAGRAGGSSSFRVTLQPTTLTASRTLTLPNVTDTVAVLGSAQTFTAAQTFRAANAIRSEAASTQDAVVIAGRAGGTGSFAVTLTPATLSSNTTLTLPNVTDTVATIGAAQTFTAAQTFRAANAIRSEAASTQDAVVIAGRAGGTGSFAATITPATLSANRTITIPNETFTIGFRNLPPVGTQSGSYTLTVNDVGKYVQVGSGGSITIPDATFAEGDAVSIFNNTTGNITITCSITTAYIAGTDTDKATMTLATRGVATVLFISSTVCVVSGNVT